MGCSLPICTSSFVPFAHREVDPVRSAPIWSCADRPRLAEAKGMGAFQPAREGSRTFSDAYSMVASGGLAQAPDAA